MKTVLYTGIGAYWRWHQVVNIVTTDNQIHTGMRSTSEDSSIHGLEEYIDKMVIDLRFVKGLTIRSIWIMCMSPDGFAYSECLQESAIEMIDR